MSTENEEETIDARIPPNTETYPVWDKEGKKHRVDNLNYHDLTVNLGWSRTDPSAVADITPVSAGQDATSSLFPVWDTRGNRHLVDELNQREMVEKLGWSLKEPLRVSEPGSVIPLASTAAPEVVSIVAGEPGAEISHVSTKIADENVELTALSTEGLRRYAAEKFDLSFGPEVSHEAILEAVLTEIE